MHCLVTGCAGFIGSHLVDHLLGQGHRVTGVDGFTDYYDRWQKENNLTAAVAQPNFRLIEADLLETDLAILLGDVDLVYHLAGQPGVRGSWGPQFGRYVDNNILATQRLLEAALTAGRVPVVYASSSSVYGNLTTMPLHEDMTPAPVSPYGVTKLAAEHLCRLYSTVHGVPTISLRLFTVFGPRQRPDMAFQRFLTSARDGQEIVVYGDGSQTRDFTYVADVVRAFALAGEHVQAGELSGQVFNVAGGARVALRGVIDLLRTVTGRKLPVRQLLAQPGDMHDTWADTANATAHLGFSPTTTLHGGLQAQWQHILSRTTGEKP